MSAHALSFADRSERAILPRLAIADALLALPSREHRRAEHLARLAGCSEREAERFLESADAPAPRSADLRLSLIQPFGAPDRVARTSSRAGTSPAAVLPGAGASHPALASASIPSGAGHPAAAETAATRFAAVGALFQPGEREPGAPLEPPSTKGECRNGPDMLFAAGLAGAILWGFLTGGAYALGVFS